MTVSSKEEISNLNTQELQQRLLQLTQSRDSDPLSQKVRQIKDELMPLFEELSCRNPYPNPKDQIPLVLGVWTPVWSTIPFQDTIPGRLRDQSYQIFYDNGYYANIARYAPGSRLRVFQKFASLLLSYDFMILQRYKVAGDRWLIQNVGIEQALRFKALPLNVEAADNWAQKAIARRIEASQTKGASEDLSLENLDRKTAARFKKIYQAQPQLEHLYIDPNFRLVRSKREAVQRYSYTIAVRRR